MESEKLLPCPFCGGEPWVQPEDPSVEGDAWAGISCVNCVVMPSVKVFADGTHLAEARAAWNTRAPADLRSALEAETDGLVEMLKAAQDWDGIAVFEHSPEEIGLEVMEHYQAVLAALAPTKGDVS